MKKDYAVSLKYLTIDVERLIEDISDFGELEMRHFEYTGKSYNVSEEAKIRVDIKRALGMFKKHLKRKANQ